MKYPSLNSTHPFRSNPDGRAKYWSRVAGNGRGMARLQSPVTVPTTQLGVRQRQPSFEAGARVGDHRHGDFVCPSCRSRVSVIVRQSAASTLPWVCQQWCSPRFPRSEHFISARVSNGA